MASEKLLTKTAMSVGIIRNRGTEIVLPILTDELKCEIITK